MKSKIEEKKRTETFPDFSMRLISMSTSAIAVTAGEVAVAVNTHTASSTEWIASVTFAVWGWLLKSDGQHKQKKMNG